MITSNEKNLLRYLLINFDVDYSLNELAKKLELAPNGAFEIVKKFEEIGVIISKKIANIKSYKINFANRSAKKLLELILMPDNKDEKIQHRYEDLKDLEAISGLCIIFGSYVRGKKNPNDLDVMFVIKKSNFEKFNELLGKARLRLPLKLHDVLLTKNDLRENLRNPDERLKEILKDGVVLWGQELLVEVIESVR